jgi:hypothetical protein
MPRPVGRPAKRRHPNERIPVATRLRGEIYNRLIDAANMHDRAVGNEIELRLERSFDVESVHRHLDELFAVISNVIRPLVVRAIETDQLTVADLRSLVKLSGPASEANGRSTF